MSSDFSKDPLFESAKQLHDQAEFLLKDEIAYATSLREARKTSSGLVLLIAGIGIFRLDLYRSADHVLSVPFGYAVAIRLLFVAAIAMVGWGAYRIFTERDFWEELPDLSDEAPSGRPKNNAALAILYLADTVLADYLNKTPIEVMRMRTEGLRLAYARLRDANRRIRKRLAKGTLWVFGGLALIFVAFVVYSWGLDFSQRTGGQDVQHQAGK